MSESFHYQRRVEFRETDAAGIAHFSSYIAYMEEAEHALFRHLGLSVMMNDEQGELGFPRVNVHCDYRDSSRFEEVLDIDVSLARLGEKSITFCFAFTHQGHAIAQGRMTSVCCRIPSGQAPHSVPIPAVIAQRLRPYLTSTAP